MIGCVKDISGLLCNEGMNIINREYYRFFTDLLLHVNWIHLLVNVISVYFVVMYLDDKIKPESLILFSIIVAVVSSIVFSMIYPNAISMGGSPIIFAFIGLIVSMQLLGKDIEKFQLRTWYGNWTVGYAVLANIPLFSSNISTLVIHLITLLIGMIIGSLCIKTGILKPC